MSLPQWKGLFDWSMKYQDGTNPSQWEASEYDPQKMKWLEGVLKHYMQDFAARMKQIKSALDTGVGKPAQGEAAGTAADSESSADQVLSLRDKELLLEELMDIVDSIDYARDLHRIGGLGTLLSILSCPHPSLQWRAAEVAATCVQNNPPVQQWFVEGGVLPQLMNLLQPINPPAPDSAAAGEDSKQAMEDATLLRVKGLLALSGLVRHNTPALNAAVQSGLPARLAALCADPDQRVQRKAMSLAQYIACQQPQASAKLLAGGAVDAAVAVLQKQGSAVEGSDLRTAAVNLLSQLAQAGPDGWDALQRCTPLPSCLARLESALAALPSEDKDSCADEQHAVSTLVALLAGPRPTSGSAASDHVTIGADEPGHRVVHVGPQVAGTNAIQGLLSAP